MFALVMLNLVGTFVATIAFYGIAIVISQGNSNGADSLSNFPLTMPFAFCGGNSFISIDSYFGSTTCLPLPGIA